MATRPPIIEAPQRLQPQPSLRPFLKWPGGKSAELRQVAARMPPLTGRFIDPFVGGGSVLLAVPCPVPAVANDACPELVALFRGIAFDDRSMRDALERLAGAWDGLVDPCELDGLARAFRVRGALDAQSVGGECVRLATALAPRVAGAGPGLASAFRDRIVRDVPAKLRRMRAVEERAGRRLDDGDLRDNLEGAVRAALYTSVRDRYNRSRSIDLHDEWRVADFLLLREYAYAAMFRFNSRGEFNVPYGGVTYNQKSLRQKLSGAFAPEMVERLSATKWHEGDFEPFLDRVGVEDDDLVFVDPPYDSTFSDYDGRAFTARDQRRLARVLGGLGCRVIVVVRDSPLVRELYEPSRWCISSADKTYMWTIKSRNDRQARHLTITNY